MSNLEHIAALVAAEQQQYTTYQTYEQLRETNQRLVEEYPELARTEVVGYGADRTPDYPDGRPIEALIVSDPEYEADRPYVLKKLGHENELPATLDQAASARVLCENPDLLDESGYNFIFSTTEHPDGIALQRWVETGEGEFDPATYALGFYRSAATEQVSWGYPFRHGKANFTDVTSEVAASMHLMRTYKPAVMHEVHASGIDDVYYYVSHPSDELQAALTEISADKGFAMQVGEPEMPYIQKIGPGLYHPLFTARAAYDYRAKHTPPEQMRWVNGTTSAEYLSGLVHDPFMMVSEVPYLTADALRDMSLSGMTRREAGLLDVETHRQLVASVASYYAALRPRIERSDAADVGRLARSIQWWYTEGALGRVLAEQGAVEAPEFAREATVAEAYTTVQRWDFYATAFLGEVHHLAERLGGEAGMMDDIRGQVEERIAAIDEVSPLQISPLPDLVGVQAMAGFALTEHSRRARSEQD